MKLNSLRDFLTVVERGSLRAAARQLGVAQPAISRNIQELEKELGVVLFERQARGVTLSPMGEVFLRRARAIRGEIERSQDELDQLRGETHGRVRVALSTVAHMALLPNALQAFRQRYPGVKLTIMDSLLPKVEQQLVDGMIDVYVGPAPESMSSSLKVEKLFDNSRVIMGRIGHPLANARNLRDLAGAEWVTASLTHEVQDELGPLFALHGLSPPKLVVEAHSALTFLFVVAHSDLLMLLPIQWTQAPLLRNALQRIPVEEPLNAPPICIVQRTGLPLTPAAEYFCDMMRRASMHMETLLA